MSSKLLTTLTFLLASIASLHAQQQQQQQWTPIHFSCPHAGTIEQRTLGKIQYQDVTSKDTFVCNRLDYSNRPVALLFNFYGIIHNKENGEMRQEMIDLLSFSKPSVSFVQISDLGFEHRESWFVLRRETLKIDDKSFDTVVLRQDDEQPSGNQLHQIVDHWLDPIHGLWLKQEFVKYLGGTVNGARSSYQDISVTLP